MKKLLALAFAGVFLLGCTPEEAPKPQAAAQKAEKPKTAVLINGLGVYSKPGMMGAVEEAMLRRGWNVVILNHTDAKRMTVMPRVVVTHSKGGNSLLKRAREFRKNPPDLIITIDPGRLPQWSWAPGTKARVVNIRCWYHPIGGQQIIGADKEYEVCGTAHIAMPHDQRVIDIIIKEVEALK